MICFEVRVNGKVCCTAGVGDLGVLSAILTWVKRDPRDCPEGLGDKEWSEEALELSVGGSRNQGERGHEFLDWIKGRRMSVGDEITIGILNVPGCDPPVRVRLETTEYVREMERQYYERMKEDYEAGGQP
jgi:hypothetical protein